MTRDFTEDKWHEKGGVLRNAMSWQLAMSSEGKSPRTIGGYLETLELFDTWLRNNDRPTAVNNVTRDDVRAWLVELRDRVKASTVQARYKGLRVFFAWLVAE